MATCRMDLEWLVTAERGVLLFSKGVSSIFYYSYIFGANQARV